MQIPGAAEKLICISANASPDGLLTPLYLTTQMLHSILNLLGESPAACFKMQLLFCLCILRVLYGLCTVHPRKFPCHFRRISLFPPHPQFVPTKKGNAISGQISPDSGRTKEA